MQYLIWGAFLISCLKKKEHGHVIQDSAMVTVVYHSMDELNGVGVIKQGLCPPLHPT
jgi:hypothetical protein